ncbi:MAG: DUF2917 domain-containing protein [Burkholderiales bacterium]|nr:DUF2917 domain-containing protein [Burkholderiales bacterium]
MRPDLNLSGVTLAKNQIRRIDSAIGAQIQCLHGNLWLTQDGDPRDIILQPGDEHRFERDAVTYVSALSDASFLLLRGPVALERPLSGGWIKALQARLAS